LSSSSGTTGHGLDGVLTVSLAGSMAGEKQQPVSCTSARVRKKKEALQGFFFSIINERN
jgi:hypothetical protein